MSVTGIPEWAFKLTERQRIFCEEFLVDFNAAAAYDRAKYEATTYESARSGASKLLKMPLVRRYINYLQRQRIIRSQITQDRVLEELALIAFSDITDFMSWSADTGIVLKDSASLGEGLSVAIAEVSEQQLPRGGKSRSLKLHSKMEALKLLSKHLGLMDTDLNNAMAVVRKYGYEVVDVYAGGVPYQESTEGATHGPELEPNAN